MMQSVMMGSEPVQLIPPPSPDEAIFELTVQPEIISRSMWIMLPAIIDIECSMGGCDLFTRVSYKPVMSVLPMPPLIIEDIIKQLIFVMPVWWARAHDETLTVTVTRKECGTASDTISVEMLSYPF